MNKKVLIIVLIALVGAIAIIVLSNVFGDNVFKEEPLQEITYKTLKKKIDKKESFILLIEKDDCSYCKMFVPKLQKVIEEYNLVVYYVRTNKLSKSNSKEFSNLVSYSGTPTTVFFKDGKELDKWTRIDGNQSRDIIIARLKTTGYIKE